MIKKLFNEMYQNKNILMLVTSFLYVLSIFSVLSNNIIISGLLFTVIGIICIHKNIFPLKTILIWVFVFYFGIVNTSLRLKNEDFLLNLAPINSEITGQIISIPQGLADNKPKFFLKANNIKYYSKSIDLPAEKVLVTINNYQKDNDFSDLKIYNTYSFTGRLSVPFKVGNPSQFDYSNYLRNYGTYSLFYAKDYKVIQIKPSFKSKLLQNINNYREYVMSVHSKYLQTPNLEILGGIVFGDDAVSPPKNIKESFVNSGLLHILAASGMNVAFIYTFFFQIMSFFKVNYRVNVSLGIVMVLIYSLMTGLGASIIRATLMLVFVLVGKLIDRDAHSVSLLSFVAFLMLIYNPFYVNDVGFQLSFIVTLGIILMAGSIVKFNNKLKDSLISTLSIPIIAQIWVIPVQIFYFNNISLYSVMANIMSVPLLMVISFGGFMSALLSFIKPFSSFVCAGFDYILNPLISAVIWISDFFGNLPYANIQTQHPSIFQLLIYYSVLICGAALMNKEYRENFGKIIWKIIVILVILFGVTFISIPDKAVEITVFDVGNADCFLIKSPENKYAIIDTGKAGYSGGKSQAEIIMLKYFKDVGIKNVDSIIITHFDNDHSGGASDFIKMLNVNNVYVNDLNHKSTSAQNIYQAAKDNNTKIIKAVNDQKISLGSCGIINFISLNGDGDNDSSVVTLFEYGKFKMLFTGDIGSKTFAEMLGYFPQNVDVLKVPHHGAANVINSDIINYLAPKYSIISTGENKFGHPNIYTMRLLKGSNVLRTDINNSIRIKVYKDCYKVYTYDIIKKKYRLYNKICTGKSAI